MSISSDANFQVIYSFVVDSISAAIPSHDSSLFKVMGGKPHSDLYLQKSLDLKVFVFVIHFLKYQCQSNMCFSVPSFSYFLFASQTFVLIMVLAHVFVG